MKRKNFRMFLTAILTFLLVPKVVFASDPTNLDSNVLNVNTGTTYKTLSNAISTADSDDTLKLLNNINENITVGKNLTLDLNGKILKGTGTTSTITISSGATMNLCDSDADAVHYYKYSSNGSWVWNDTVTDGAIPFDTITDSTANDTPVILKGGAITGGTGTIISNSYGGGIYNAGTLIMNGGNIIGNSVYWYGGGIYSIGTFQLNGGNIVGNYTAIHGAGVYISGTETKFIMNDGHIIYNASNDQAGGVYLQYGYFELNDGSISHNQSQHLGGGVICSGTMKMYGGEITYNKVISTDSKLGYGGGLHNVSYMYLYNGNISNNSARYGAGIYNGYDEIWESEHYISEGHLFVTGGTVNDNNCSINGGGAYYRNGSITLGKKANISGNKKGLGQDSSEQNIYLPGGMTIGIASDDDAPTSGMEIGVTMASNTGYFTTATATEACDAYFFADESGKSVAFDSSKNQLQIVNGQIQKHDGITFIAWTSSDSLPTAAGNYYLTSDVTLSGQWYVNVPWGTINLCLNGHVIRQSKANERVIQVGENSTLNIYDCSNEPHYFTQNNESSPWILDDSQTSSQYSVIGGVIIGGSLTGESHGGGVSVDGTFSLYGGNIVGNQINNTITDQAFGAGAFVWKSGVFNMYGGSIVGNVGNGNTTVGTHGGGVAVGTNAENNGKFNMYGGAISNNYACLWAGGVNNWGTIVMKGGTISNNIANSKGGGGVSNAATFTMTGGTITNNNADTIGGGVVGDGTVTIGGTAVITDNYIDEIADNLSIGGTLKFATDDNEPKTGMHVGITTRKTSFPATFSDASTTDYSKYFTSDKTDYIIYYKSSDKMLYLAAPSTVTIDLNGGSYSALDGWEYNQTNRTYSKTGSKFTLPDAPTAPAFMKFKGWKNNTDLVAAGTEIVFENTETRIYTAEYEKNITSGIKSFATIADLTNPDCFALYTDRGSGIAQNVNFGNKSWYIAGKDEDGSLVLMSAPGNFDNSAFGTNSTYSTSTVRSILTTAMDNFTEAEQNMMQSTTCSYVPTEGDKLYLANGIYNAPYNIWITVGVNNGIAIGLSSTNSPEGSPYAVRSENIGEDWFWLRVPHNAGDGKYYALIALPGLRQDGVGGVHFWEVTNSLCVLPAMNLNLASVLFASSAPVASTSTTFDDGMNFRIAANERINSSAMYTNSQISVTKETDDGDLYLYVQGNDSTGDWIWSTQVTANSSYDVSDIHNETDLTDCAIWLETFNTEDNLAYAKEADATSPYTITLDSNGGLNGTASVEVTLYSDMPEINVPTKKSVVFTGYYDAEAGGTKYYNADGTSAKVWDKSSNATLYAHWHEHSWTVVAGTASDTNILYAICSSPECDCAEIPDDLSNARFVEIEAANGEYNGNSFEASLDDNNGLWEATFGFLPEIYYEYKESAADNYATAGNKKDAGYYRASISVNNTVAYIEYQITKKSFATILSMDNYVAGETPAIPELFGYEGDGQTTFSYKMKDADDSTYTTSAPTTPWGDYTVKAEVAETQNYASATTTCDFSIMPKVRASTISINMPNYEYGAASVPAPYVTLSVDELAENPLVTYYYNTSNSYDGAVKWENITATSLNAETYFIFAILDDTDTYSSFRTDIFSFDINKADSTCIAPSSKQNLIYSGKDQALVISGSTESGTLIYCLAEDGEYSTDIPVGKDAKEYTVFYKVVGDVNHNDSTPASVKVTIGKGEWKVSAPTAIELSFTDSEQALVNAGSVMDVDDSPVANKLLYSLTETGEYSANIPSATKAGSYNVYYKVEGDANHNEYVAKYVVATIENKEIPGNNDEPNSGNNDEPKPGNNEEPQPGNNDEPNPGNNDEPNSGNNDEPKPGNNEEPQPANNEEPAANSNEEPEPDIIKPVFTISDKDLKANSLSIADKFKVVESKSTLKVTWSKVSNADGYFVWAVKNGKSFESVKPQKVKGSKNTSLTLKTIGSKKYNKKKDYKIYVAAYKTVDGEDFTIAKSVTAYIAGSKSKYTNSKSITVKSKVSVKKGKTVTLNAKITKADSKKKFLSTKHVPKLRYEASNAKIKVDANGKVKGVKKGTAYVYIYAQNGMCKKVKITVK